MQRNNSDPDQQFTVRQEWQSNEESGWKGEKWTQNLKKKKGEKWDAGQNLKFPAVKTGQKSKKNIKQLA